MSTCKGFAFIERNVWSEALIKREESVLYRVPVPPQCYITADLGQFLALGCHRKTAQSKKKVKAPMTRPSGRDHKLRQLAAERLEVNSDPDCCSFILQRHLILFIKLGVVSFMSSTTCNYSSIRGRARLQALKLQFDFTSLTYNRKWGVFFLAPTKKTKLNSVRDKKNWTLYKTLNVRLLFPSHP